MTFQQNQSFGLQMNYLTSEGDFSSEVSYCLGKANEVSSRFQVDNRYKEDLKCIYLSPRYDSNASLEGLRYIYTNKDEQFLADALKVLDPNAQNPVFLNNVMLVDVGMSQRIPINLMGNGIRKIVSFLTSIYACRDGVVLIDELSNGFHYSVMKSMWEIVIRAAIRNNVQIFATTHDIDSIRGFQQAAAVIENESGRAIASGIKLQRLADDELRAYRFTVQELGYAMDQEMELR